MTHGQLQLCRFASTLALGMLVSTTAIDPTWSWPGVAFDTAMAILTAWLWLVAQPEPKWRLRIEQSLAAGRSSRWL
jgi:hypothetical protein